MRAAIQSASDFIQHNTTLLTNYSLHLTFMDTKCSGSEAVRMWASHTSASRVPLAGGYYRPDVILGFECSVAASAMLPVALGAQIPMVGAACSSGSLSNQELFVRTVYSNDISGQLAGAIAHSIGLTSVGAVFTSTFQTLKNHLSTYRNITSCGYVLFQNNAVSLVRDQLQQLHTTNKCRW